MTLEQPPTSAPPPAHPPADRLSVDQLLLRKAVGRQATRISVLSALALVAGMVLGVALCQFLVREQMQLQAGAVAQLQNEIRGLTGDIQRLEATTAVSFPRGPASSHSPHASQTQRTAALNSLTDPPPGFVRQIGSSLTQRPIVDQSPTLALVESRTAPANAHDSEQSLDPFADSSADLVAQPIVRRTGAVSPAALIARRARTDVTLAAGATSEQAGSSLPLDECPAMPGAAHLIPLPEAALPPARTVIVAAPRPSPRPALLSFASGRRVVDSAAATPRNAAGNAPSSAASSDSAVLR